MELVNFVVSVRNEKLRDIPNRMGILDKIEYILKYVAKATYERDNNTNEIKFLCLRYEDGIYSINNDNYDLFYKSEDLGFAMSVDVSDSVTVEELQNTNKYFDLYQYAPDIFDMCWDLNNYDCLRESNYNLVKIHQFYIEDTNDFIEEKDLEEFFADNNVAYSVQVDSGFNPHNGRTIYVPYIEDTENSDNISLIRSDKKGEYTLEELNNIKICEELLGYYQMIDSLIELGDNRRIQFDHTFR